MCRRAFTLLEIMLVMVLMGLLAGAAVFSFAAPVRAMRARQAIEQIRMFDGSARESARRFGCDVEIEIDLADQRLTRSELLGKKKESSKIPVPSGSRIEQVRTAAGSASFGRVVIRCSPQGISRSYALKLIGPQGTQWLLFAGMSGEVSLLDVSQMESIFAALSRRDFD